MTMIGVLVLLAGGLIAAVMLYGEASRREGEEREREREQRDALERQRKMDEVVAEKRSDDTTADRLRDGTF